MSSPEPLACTFALRTPPPTGSAAIAVIDLQGDIDAALKAMRVAAVAPGRAVLRRWHDAAGTRIDELVISRPSEHHAMLFPHAGPAVLRRVLDALRTLGLTPDSTHTPLARFPEASSPLEARLLDALARAHSPMAIDLLLQQPARWSDAALPEFNEAASRILRRLITPALVVALGPPNIGKSSLLNALAGRQVALVADEPGTTRDHVGVHLNLADLVVRYLDAPGIDVHPAGVLPELAEAQASALHAAQHADLILLCADARSNKLPASLLPNVPTIRVGLRADLGPPPGGCDALTSVRDQRGLSDLTSLIRDRLVPPSLLADTRKWVFWDD